MSPAVSVLLPVRDAASTLAECLASLGGQTLRDHEVVAVDDGNGCVTPSAETVADNTYQPLSRPIFLYVSAAAAARGEASAFARFFVNPENARRVQEIGYVPLPTATPCPVSEDRSAPPPPRSSTSFAMPRSLTTA